MRLFLITILLFLSATADRQWQLSINTDNDGNIKAVEPVGDLVFDVDDEDVRKNTSMPYVRTAEYTSGWDLQFYDAEFMYCESFVNAPTANLWGKGAKGILYFIALFYTFLGVSIVADVFMSSIEVITASQFTVAKEFTNEEGQSHTVDIQVHVWNETVANLSLLALGSSAPEILLAVIEVVTTLGQEAGELGPSTIVGSAAFNLFMISAICAVSVPDGEERRISRLNVFLITAVASVFAYLWMIITITLITPEVIDLWEAFLTLLFFPLLVGVAYAVDVDLFADDEKVQEANTVISVEDRVSKELEAGGDKKVDAKQTAAAIERSMLANKSPLWWRINGARFLSGKSRLVKPEDIVMKDEEAEMEEHIPDQKELAAAADFLTDFSKTEFESVLHFYTPSYSVQEDAKAVTVKVVREGDLQHKHTVNFETVNMTAQAGESAEEGDYVYTAGTLVFNPGQKKAKIEVEIHHDDKVEEDEVFAVVLSDPRGKSVGLMDPKMCTVTIIDVSDPGVFEFPDTVVSVKENVGELKIPVMRRSGCTDRVTVDYETRDGSAKEGVDYFGVRGSLVFENGETRKDISVTVCNNKEYDSRKRNFTVALENPTNSSSLNQRKRNLTVGITDDEAYSKIVSQVFAIIGSGHDLSTHTWRQQIIEAMRFEEEDPVAMIMHALTFPWKLMFALLPPTSYYGGWLTFGSSLAAVGAVTFVIGDLASTWGCMLEIPEAIVALSVVALGTSMPDTFASITATQMAPDADAAIGNITGSNSVNVFLGLGLPWVIATVYAAIHDEEFVQPQGTLSFSVIVFCPLAIICLGTLVVRNIDNPCCGNVGALGGSKFSRQVMAAVFASFWFFFILMAIVSTI